MTLEDIQSIFEKMAHVTQDIKWGQDLCFNIGGKMFLVTAPDSMPVSASFKADEATLNELIERDGFKPAPYLARHKWVQVDDINRISEKEWRRLITQSYELIKSKLPKSKR
jgi:predicted DNA-binding protein (MmcQ/YjbR family)